MAIDLNAAMQKYATVTPQMANIWSNTGRRGS